MLDSNEQKPEVKPPAEIKRETSDAETNREYKVFSYCVLAKDVKMPTGLMIGMLKENPDFIVISNCSRDPTDDPNIDTGGYVIKHNGGFYIFVHKDIEILNREPKPSETGKEAGIMSSAGPIPGEKRVRYAIDADSKCNQDVSYFYVDVKLKLHSGETQVHRLLAVYHPVDLISKELCKKVVCAKLKPVLQGEGKQPITHICGALNWRKGSEIVVAWQNVNVSKIFKDYGYEFKYFVKNERNALISQIFVSENDYSRWSWGTLFTNTPRAIEMREKPRHPNYFLEEDLKVKDEVSLEKGEAAQKTPSGTPKGQKSNEIAAVVVFHIKPVVQKSGPSAQTAEKLSTSAVVKEEVDPGVDEVTEKTGKISL